MTLTNRQVRKALQGSIQKWQKIVKGTGNDYGVEDCPLCQMFDDCEGCPVAVKTRRCNCAGSPYVEWSLFGKKSTSPTLRARYAQAELDFLISLDKEFFES